MLGQALFIFMIKILLKEIKAPVVKKQIKKPADKPAVKNLPPPEPTTIIELQKQLEEGIRNKKISPLSIVLLLNEVGFRENEQLTEAVHIVLGESMGVVNLVHPNDDGTSDYGIWQINDRHIIGSSYHAAKIKEIEDRYQKVIDSYKKSKTKTPQQIQDAVTKVEQNKKNELSKNDSGFGVPFTTKAKAFDPYEATLYAKISYEINNKRNPDQRWLGWVDSASLLNKKYGIEKRKMAEDLVKRFYALLNG